MDPDLEKILASWFSDDVDRSSLAPIMERLKSDEDFRIAFVQELTLLGQLKAVQSSEPRWLELEDLLTTTLDNIPSDADFESQVMNSIDEPVMPKPKVRPNNQPNYRLAQAGLLVGLACTALLVIWFNAREDNPEALPNQLVVEDRNEGVNDPSPANPSQADRPIGTETVAVLSQSVNAIWDGERKPQAGDSLSTGNLVLQSGTIQIEFLAGVRLMLRGPANFELRAVDEVLLREGAASCYVTEMGRGFRILTKEMEVIDLGTAFSIDVQNGKQPEVHVLEGSVEINAPDRPKLELKQFQAIRMSATGPEDVAYSPDRFPQPSELEAQQLERSQQRYRSWQQQNLQLSKDPSVMLHYTFEESDPTALELINHAANSAGATNGAVIGCRWSEGRWPSKRALLYRNAGDRVLFQVPGNHESLTLLAWARIDGLTQDTTSLMMTDEPIRRSRIGPLGNNAVSDAAARRDVYKVQTVRWELNGIESNVTFNVGYGPSAPREWKYDRSAVSQPATFSNNWGSWACLAVTCDTKTGEILHYLNGQRIGAGELTHDEPLLLDFMELGNLGVTTEELQESGGRSQRRFYGAFDEVMIADRVFNDAELTKIWENGKP